MTKQLVWNYLINGGFTIIKMILFALGSVIAFKVVDSSLWKVDITKLLREGNIGAWLFLSALFVSLAYCVGQL